METTTTVKMKMVKMDSVLEEDASPGSVRDKYSLGRELGQGHFSVVRSGRDRESGKQVAVKIIRKTTNHTIELLQREIAVLKELDHPNVIRLFDVFESPRRIYLVMEHVSGGELYQKICDSYEEGFPEKDAAAIMKSLLSAVSYFHGKGITHRDLKPENILYLSENSAVDEVKVIDFGFAKWTSEDSPLITTCGTPTYVAPEVLSTDGGYSKAADLWSLGVIMYILLCGFPPFYSEEEGTGELFRIIQAAAYDFPDPYWTNISSEAKQLVTKFLTVDPEKRITAEGALKHPWILKRVMCEDSAKEPSESVSESGNESNHDCNGSIVPSSDKD